MNWAALVAGIVSVGSALSIVAGHPALGAIISAPETSQALTAAIGGLAGLWSAFAPSVLPHVEH